MTTPRCGVPHRLCEVIERNERGPSQSRVARGRAPSPRCRVVTDVVLIRKFICLSRCWFTCMAVVECYAHEQFKRSSLALCRGSGALEVRGA